MKGEKMKRCKQFVLFFLAAVIGLVATFQNVNLLRAEAMQPESPLGQPAQDPIRTFLPLIVQSLVDKLLQRISDPIGVTPAHILQSQTKVDVVDIFTHPEGHLRLWVEADKLHEVGGDIWNLRYNFNDAQNPNFTYIPNLEVGDQTPIESWWYQIKQGQGYDFPVMIAELRKSRHDDQADKVQDLLNRQAWVRVFQLNRRAGIRWGISTGDDTFAHREQFVAEVWRFETIRAAEAKAENFTYLPFVQVPPLSDVGDEVTRGDEFFFKSYIVHFKQITSNHKCDSLHLWWYSLNGSPVDIITKDSVVSLARSTSETVVKLSWSWGNLRKDLGSTVPSRYLLWCRNDSLPGGIWP